MLQHKRKSISVPQSSIVLYLQPILALRNVLHPYTFLLKHGFNPNSANKILNNKAVQINFNQLTILCTALNCTPNDLFALRDLQPPPEHQLEKLQTMNETPLNPMERFSHLGLNELKTMY